MTLLMVRTDSSKVWEVVMNLRQVPHKPLNKKKQIYAVMIP